MSDDLLFNFYAAPPSPPRAPAPAATPAAPAAAPEFRPRRVAKGQATGGRNSGGPRARHAGSGAAFARPGTAATAAAPRAAGTVSSSSSASASAPAAGTERPKQAPAAKPQGKISSLFPRRNTGSEQQEQTPQPDGPRPPRQPRTRRTQHPGAFVATQFSQLALGDRLLKQLQEHMNFSNLTAPQQLAIPLLLTAHDVLLKSPTGTGKTLAYAVPIVNDLQGLQHKVTRADGPLAIVITPTRELTQQCYDVFHKLLMAYPWVVPGALTGGEKKKSEKSRLRKGINVLVATPGRLRDHVENTRSLDLKSVRWLVLDEADRLMDTGFEKDVQYIVRAIEEARAKTRKTRRRTSVLVSATLTPDVQRLAASILSDAYFLDTSAPEGEKIQHLRADTAEGAAEDGAVRDSGQAADDTGDDTERIEATVDASGTVLADGEVHDSTEASGQKKSLCGQAKVPEHLSTTVEKLPVLKAANIFTTSEKLEQYYVVVPPKLRLVMLVAFLKAQCQGPSAGKAVVFLQSRSEVAFLEKLLAAAQAQRVLLPEQQEGEDPLAHRLQDLSLYYLHGGMEQGDRNTVFRNFCKAQSGALLCTDVAARGLDLPAVTWILQVSAPSSAAEYVHRVGRTARLEASGKALMMLLPNEEPFVDVLLQHDLNLQSQDCMNILRSLAPAKLQKHDEEVRTAATTMQLGLERLVINKEGLKESAEEAFLAFVRAYATYPTDVKHIFQVKKLHFGHVAKSFALRDTPQEISARQSHAPASTNKFKKGTTSFGSSGAPGRRAGKMSLAERMRAGAKRELAIAKSEFDGAPLTAKKRKTQVIGAE